MIPPLRRPVPPWSRALALPLLLGLSANGCVSNLEEDLATGADPQTSEPEPQPEAATEPEPTAPVPTDPTGEPEPEPTVEPTLAPVDPCSSDAGCDGGTGDDACPDDPDKREPGECGCGLPDEDSDEDGVLDCDDECAGDPLKTAAGLCGCGVADEGRTDPAECIDGCPDDPDKWEEGACGCGVADTDTDGDATVDCVDECPEDPDKVALGACGCGVADTDTDGDGASDCIDRCPEDPDKTSPGVCDCGAPETDVDEDTVPDCVDGCVGGQAPTGTPSSCGCGMGNIDTDGDGTADCADACPDDPNKSEEGACGCGLADDDTDSDGALDCQDPCPEDAFKLEPLECGCGIADTDTDGDGEPDCNDGCPNDPAKTAPGDCGCSFVDDLGDDTIPECDDLAAGLAHRYSFSGTGTTATDSKGSLDGAVTGTSLTDTNAIAFVADSYVDLPNDLMTGLVDATFEAWLRRGSLNGSWQRVFDFGDNDSGVEGNQGVGTNYVFLTPRTSSSAGSAVRLVFRPVGGAETVVTGASSLPLDAPSHVAAVFDDGNDSMVLYVDGVLIGSTAWTGALSEVNAINNWLGQSQFAVDADLDATLDEFRVYAVALDENQVAYSFQAGPDAPFLN